MKAKSVRRMCKRKIGATVIDRSSETVQLLFFKSFASTLVRRLSGK